MVLMACWPLDALNLGFLPFAENLSHAEWRHGQGGGGYYFEGHSLPACSKKIGDATKVTLAPAGARL